MKKLGSNIRSVRIDGNLSQAAVASMAGMTRTAYGNIERGQTERIRLSTLAKIADALDVRVSYIIDYHEKEPSDIRTKKEIQLLQEILQEVKKLRKTR